MPNYLLDLREIVGSRPLVVAGVAGIVVKEARILLIKRNDNGLWGMPAGSVELYESPQEAICRELQEETGLKTTISEVKLLNVFGGESFTYTYPNGDCCSNVTTSFLITQFSGELLKRTEESEDCRFFAMDQLPRNIVHHEKIMIDDYIQMLQTDSFELSKKRK